jgi:hypothetical protein
MALNFMVLLCIEFYGLSKNGIFCQKKKWHLLPVLAYTDFSVHFTYES